MSKQNLIFYSNSCDYCRDLAKLMAEVGVLNNFKRFCTDDPNIKIPSIIKTVPTIIVRGINKPLSGSDAFNYIKQLKNKDNTNNSNVTNNQTEPLPSTISDSYSTTYSALDGCDDMSCPINTVYYSGIDDKSSNNVKQFNNKPNMPHMTKNESTDELSKRMEEMETMRRREIPDVKRI